MRIRTFRHAVVLAALTLSSLVVRAKDRITILHDALGRRADLTQGWGYAALVEYHGKRMQQRWGESKLYAGLGETIQF